MKSYYKVLNLDHDYTLKCKNILSSKSQEWFTQVFMEECIVELLSQNVFGNCFKTFCIKFFIISISQIHEIYIVQRYF